MAIIKALNIFEDLFRPISLRNGNYFCQVQGVYDEQTYNDFLALVDSKTQETEEQTALIPLPLPIPTDRMLIDSISEQLPTMVIGHYEQDDISLAAALDMNKALLAALDVVLPYACSREGFKNTNIRDNFIVKMLIWVNLYAQNWHITKLETPKFVCYGDLKKHEAYFLMILAIAGIDVVHLSPQISVVMENVDGEGLAQIINSGNNSEVLPLKMRIEKGVAIERVTTTAKKATKELEELLYQGTGIFRPWQFADGDTNPVLMDAAYEDIAAYWNAPARLRTGFKTTGRTVYIPVFFTKLSGAHADRQEYFQMIDQLRSSKNCYFTQSSNLAKSGLDQQAVFSLAFCLNSDKSINRQALKEHKLYQSMLPYRDSMQSFVLNKLDALFTSYDEHYFRFPLTDKERVLLMAAVFTADEQILSLIEGYDFTADIPKLVFYFNNREVFDPVDALLVAFFHLMGMDIVILSPNGGNNIELVIDKAFVNFIQLQEYVQDLPLPTHNVGSGNTKKSLLQRLFSLK